MTDFPDFVVTMSFDKIDEERITVAFTIALAALTKGQRTAILLMLDGVRVATTGYGDDIDIGDPFMPLTDIIETFLDQGGAILACGACMEFKGILPAELMEQIQVVSAGDVVDLLTNARGSLQFN